MKIKAQVLTCTHETKDGNSNYVFLIRKNENPNDIIEEMKKKCNYNKDDGEYFGSRIKDIIIDTDDFEAVDN